MSGRKRLAMRVDAVLDEWDGLDLPEYQRVQLVGDILAALTHDSAVPVPVEGGVDRLEAEVQRLASRLASLGDFCGVCEEPFPCAEHGASYPYGAREKPVQASVPPERERFAAHLRKSATFLREMVRRRSDASIDSVGANALAENLERAAALLTADSAVASTEAVEGLAERMRALVERWVESEERIAAEDFDAPAAITLRNVITEVEDLLAFRPDTRRRCFHRRLRRPGVAGE